MRQLLDRFDFRIGPTTVAFVKSTNDDRLWCAHTMRFLSFRRLCVQQKTKIAWCVPGFRDNSTVVLLASHMILISSHTDILHDPHVKQICIPSQHTSAGLTILNVLSSPKQLLLGIHSLRVWSLAPHWMLSRWHWGDRYQASVF